MEYCLALKREEILAFAVTWTNIKLSEISRSQNGKHYDST